MRGSDAMNGSASMGTARLAIIGAGWLGETLLRRWLAAGVSPANLVATHRRIERREQLTAELGIPVLADTVEAARIADVIVLAVRPQDAAEVACALAPGLSDAKIVVSLAAAITLPTLRGWLGPVPAACRVLIPPTVATGGGPMIATTDESRLHVRSSIDGWFGRLGGRLVWAQDEHADAMLVSIGGLAPYIGCVLDTFAAWLERHDVSREFSRELLIESLTGVARQFDADGRFTAGLAHAVTPGGLTEAGLAALQRGAVPEHLSAALDAMLARADELRTAARAQSAAGEHGSR
jgi:pyrroline-5-carboxylate reductase